MQRFCALCAFMFIVGAGCRGPCPFGTAPQCPTEEPHGPPPCAAKSPPREERPTLLPPATPVAPAPQRVLIEVVQRAAPAPAAAPALPAPVPAAPPAAPTAPATPAFQPVQTLQLVGQPQAVPGMMPVAMPGVLPPVVPTTETRVALTLRKVHVPMLLPWLEPVQVQRVQPVQQAIAILPASAAPPTQYANVPVTGTALVPVQPALPPPCVPPLTALPPAVGCASPPIRSDTAAELARQLDALRGALEAAAKK
jgi:hypothetical protein